MPAGASIGPRIAIAIRPLRLSTINLLRLTRPFYERRLEPHRHGIQRLVLASQSSAEAQNWDAGHDAGTWRQRSPGPGRPRADGRRLLASGAPGVKTGRRLVPDPAPDGLLVAVVVQSAHVGLVEHVIARHFEV